MFDPCADKVPDSIVSKVSDPQNVVTSAAYLLFYRRRSEHPLGGKILQEIAESSTRPASDNSDSHEYNTQAFPGEGRRLGGSSRNGLSSALTGVGATHQAGDGEVGGLQARIHHRNDNADEDQPPEYSRDPPSGERSLAKANAHGQEGMDIDDFGANSHFPSGEHYSWTAAASTTDTHDGPFQQAQPHSDGDDDEDLFDDVASDKADGGGGLSDSDVRLAVLGADADTDTGNQAGEGMMSFDDAPIQDIPPPLNTEDGEDLPVIELTVNDEDKIVSD